MKTISYLSILILFAMQSYAQSENKVDLTLEFEATEYDTGSILFALFNSEDSHMETNYKEVSSILKDSKAKIVVENIPEGFYSFSYFHDVNGNGELDKNMLGIPKEPYGFSNGQEGNFGPPNFQESKIEIKSDTIIQLKIK
ncbi:DUF2141 domain-containing protein [Psychroflexus gondwanensis]|jgi:uncharacterized protein (DUF2141 family)|uniref:DUF2141 domain-containing protein n=1 Tax=Psychroflexus gondwanensis TaxID=251 RepID=UPI0011BDB424|nr:DUF2141 domain-containing protein [Psychroflexus gondwanensis]TXE21122.1 DUF2141 domain-containing protein [Psychroflexus gondwanensis]